MAGQPYQSPFLDAIEEVPDIEWLFRRVFPDFIDWANRDADGRPRVKSGAFQDYSDKRAAELGYEAPAMSVAVRSIVLANDLQPSHLLSAYPGSYGLVAITAAEARAVMQGVMLRPTELEPWHAIVFDTTARKRRPMAQSELAICATNRWIIVPPDPGP